MLLSGNYKLKTGSFSGYKKEKKKLTLAHFYGDLAQLEKDGCGPWKCSRSIHVYCTGGASILWKPYIVFVFRKLSRSMDAGWAAHYLSTDKESLQFLQFWVRWISLMTVIELVSWGSFAFRDSTRSYCPWQPNFQGHSTWRHPSSYIKMVAQRTKWLCNPNVKIHP